MIRFNLFILFICTIATMQLFAQGLPSGECLTWQNPLPQGNTLFDVHFVDAQTGWVVGDAGTILKTDNGGEMWTPQSSGTSERLYSVQFTDSQTGWAVGFGGIILKYDCDAVSSTQPEEPAESHVTLFPNPATDYIVIRNESAVNFDRVVFYDLTGHVVSSQTQTLPPGEETKILLPNGLSGLYILELRNHDGQRLVKRLTVLRP